MAGFDEGRLGAVIDRFYEAAARPELWREVLEEAADILDAEGLNVLPGPKASIPPFCSSRLDEAVAFGVREGWFEDNPRVIRGVRAIKDPRDIVTESMLFSPEELHRLPFHAEFIHRFGMFWFAGGFLVPDGERSLVFSVERRKDQGGFSHREIALIREMLPHLQRAGRLALHLAEGRANGVLDGFEAMGCGGVLLDRSGRVVRANARAQHHFGRGLALRGGRLHAESGKADAALQRLIAGSLRPGPAHDAPAEGAVAIPRQAGRPLLAHAAPAVGSAQDVFQKARAVLLVIDPDEGREPADVLLKTLFGLTPAEGRISRALTRGCGIREIARDQGITESTARAHLKMIFAKTGTRRQAELAVLLGRLAVASPLAAG